MLDNDVQPPNYLGHHWRLLTTEDLCNFSLEHASVNYYRCENCAILIYIIGKDSVVSSHSPVGGAFPIPIPIPSCTDCIIQSIIQ